MQHLIMIIHLLHVLQDSLKMIKWVSSFIVIRIYVKKLHHKVYIFKGFIIGLGIDYIYYIFHKNVLPNFPKNTLFSKKNHSN